MKAQSSIIFALAVGAVAGAFGLASIQQSSGKAVADPQVYAKPIAGISEENMAALRNLDSSFASLADFVEPSVVHIRTESKRNTDVLGRRMGTIGGEGSGVIYRPDGWIVTNDHVVGGFEKVTVILNDGREFDGKVTRAMESDLAVVKIEADNLPALQFGDSDHVRPGQFSMAVGSPFGLENSVTIGHVSAIGRQSVVPDQRLQDVRFYSDLIQTDASINQGNSGGPLVNVDGQVIGINSAIYSGTGQSSGIGFAIPSNVARKVVDALIKNGKVVRAFLGIMPENLKPHQMKEMKLDGGALVQSVPSDGPAALAGIQKGDVIVRIGSYPIRRQIDLRLAMFDYAPGATVKVDFIRNGQRKSVDIKLSEPRQYSQPPADAPDIDGLPQLEIPRGEEPQATDEVPPVRAGRAKLGVGIESIGAPQRKQFNIPADIEGAVIVSVDPSSVAGRLGLEPGTVLQKIGETEIRSAEDITRAMADVKWGDTVNIKYTKYGSNSMASVEQPVTFR